MKINTYLLVANFLLLSSLNSNLKAQEIDAAEKSPTPDSSDKSPILNDADLADPPVAEIRKRYLHDINDAISHISACISEIPSTQRSIEINSIKKLEILKSGLEKIKTTRLQTDVFLIAPMIENVYSAYSNRAYPSYFSNHENHIRALSYCVIHAIAEYVIDNDAKIYNENISNFIRIMSSQTFVSSHLWCDATMPIDAAGLMIIEPDAVVTLMKAQPWKNAEQFLSGNSPIAGFTEYEHEGDGLTCLKSRYIANKLTILSKWKELETWVSQRKNTSQ